jgi:hypothetical protein
MTAWLALLVALPALAGGGTAYSVDTLADSGVGSLRWAIEAANGTAGADPVLITIGPGAIGGAIQPLTPLPTLTRDHTAINGDDDYNGKPDGWIDGGLQSGGSGLVIAASNCTIVGLCVTRFPKYGIMLSAADHCAIYSCHVGVSLDGKDLLNSAQDGVVLWVSDYNQIGGRPARNRNIIAGPWKSMGDPYAGVLLANSHYNKVQNNYIGLRRSGMSALPDVGMIGVHLAVTGGMSPTGTAEGTSDTANTTMTCLGNTIGGSRPAFRNVIANVGTGVLLSTAEHNFVQGNYFGLARDGDTLIPLGTAGVHVEHGSTDNFIGGSSPGAQNVFAGGAKGVVFVDVGTASNRVVGNYFGLNAAGTAQRPLECGVWQNVDAGAQTIGGATSSCGNYFEPNASTQTFGVALATAGEGTLIRNNRFGMRPDGKNATLMDYAITVGNVQATITDNLIARARKGIDVGGPAGDARVYRNIFRDCKKAVRVTNLGKCLLGNLQNPSTSDDGGNVFRASNVWHIDNRTADRIRAEGNSFDTTVRNDIDAKIYDKLDDPTYGRVDFIPLQGGVIPTGETTSASLALTGAAAQATPRGAEIVFSLSAPAAVTVEVLNLAGRPVAVVTRDAATEAGLQRLAWTGQTAHGTAAPAGQYLVRMRARNADGQQATALAALRLVR